MSCATLGSIRSCVKINETSKRDCTDQISENKNPINLGPCLGQVVNVLALFFDNMSSNPTGVYSFCSEKRLVMAHFQKDNTRKGKRIGNFPKPDKIRFAALGPIAEIFSHRIFFLFVFQDTESIRLDD